MVLFLLQSFDGRSLINLQPYLLLLIIKAANIPLGLILLPCEAILLVPRVICETVEGLGVGMPHVALAQRNLP